MWRFAHFDLETRVAPQRHTLFRHLNFQKRSVHVAFCKFWLENVLRAATPCTFLTSQLPKVVWEWCVLCTFWLGNVLRAITACTISTSQLWKVVRTCGALHILTCKATTACTFSTSERQKVVRCFVHFDLETCFAPERRALFQQLNFQKWSVHEALCKFWLENVLHTTTACTFLTSQFPKVVWEWCVLGTLWLGNVLRATTACTFSTSQLPKVVRTCGALRILTWKQASCHSGIHFFNSSTSKSGPYMKRFVNFDLKMCFAQQQRALFSTSQLPKVVWEWCVLCTLWLGNVLRATTACTISTSQLPKVVRTCGALRILTWKHASCHNGIHFLDIWTSKNGPYMKRFANFDLNMCFAPQRRALFWHLNFQKWSENGVFCTFWLGNVLRAITACNFSSLIWPDGSAGRFREPTFRTPRAGTTQWIATFLPFRAPGSSFFWLFLFSALLTSGLRLSDSSYLWTRQWEYQ